MGQPICVIIGTVDGKRQPLVLLWTMRTLQLTSSQARDMGNATRYKKTSELLWPIAKRSSARSNKGASSLSEKKNQKQRERERGYFFLSEEQKRVSIFVIIVIVAGTSIN